MTPDEILFEAAKSGDLKSAKAAFGAGARVTARDARDFTPLHYAAQANRRSVAEFLMRQGADVNAEDNRFGLTPIDLAARGPGIHMVRLLRREEQMQQESPQQSRHTAKIQKPNATHVDNAKDRKAAKREIE
jgi:ankyrin repeat protein